MTREDMLALTDENEERDERYPAVPRPAIVLFS